MFTATKLEASPPVVPLQDPRTDYTASVQLSFESWNDDGLVHNHHWANDREDSARTAVPRSSMIVADTSGIRTPSSVLHDDIHYA